MFTETQVADFLRVVRAACVATMRYYKSADTKTLLKPDASPVTQADIEANSLICHFLANQFPNIPIVSEENESIPFETRKHWNLFWLVDPLDGTKEFVEGNPDFTVNIALIENHTPIIGFVGVPTTGDIYCGDVNKGAFKQNSDGKRTALKVSPFSSNQIRFVISRSNGKAETRIARTAFPTAELLTVGSSLKFLKIAEGMADIYFREQGINEWDTAAGHAVLLAAGGHVIDRNAKPITYGSKTLKVKPFQALGDIAFPWKKLL